MAVCACCGVAFGQTESGVLVSGQTFHNDCFKCKSCNRPLAGEKFFKTNNEVRCSACHEEAGPKCGKCGKGMTSWIEFNGVRCHKECYDSSAAAPSLGSPPSCAACGKQLSGRYAVIGGKATCDSCVPMSSGSSSNMNCSVCSKSCTAGGVMVLGAAMHADCFTCGGCSTPMKGKSFVTMNGKALCTPCAASASGGGGASGSCAACGVTFDRSKDTITQSMGKSFHPACFVCSQCKASLSASGTIFKVGPAGNPICHNCSA